MGSITRDQSLAVMATLAVNTPWEEVDFARFRLQDLIIRNPKEAGRLFAQWLENLARIQLQVFPVWKTIKVGAGPKNADEFRAAFKEAGCKISAWANDLLGNDAFRVATEETEVELVVASVAELGFKDGAKYSAICQRAKQLGLDLCRAEVGPQLRLQYTDQPNGEWLRIAMEPIADSGGHLNIFYVIQGACELYLNSYSGHPSDFCHNYDRFVFVHGK